jgi:hypothetical protein
LFGISKHKLTGFLAGAKIAQWHGKEEPRTLRFKTNNIKSLCVEYDDINIELDLAKLTPYLSKKARHVIRIGTGTGPLLARDQLFGEYLDSPRISRRGPRRTVLLDRLDRLDRLLQPETETEEQVEDEKEQEQAKQQQESLACAEELQQKESIKEAYYETQRADILTNNFLLSVFQSSFFEHDAFYEARERTC